LQHIAGKRHSRFAEDDSNFAVLDDILMHLSCSSLADKDGVEHGRSQHETEADEYHHDDVLEKEDEGDSELEYPDSLNSVLPPVPVIDWANMPADDYEEDEDELEIVDAPEHSRNISLVQNDYGDHREAIAAPPPAKRRPELSQTSANAIIPTCNHGLKSFNDANVDLDDPFVVHL
jgi:hypothetical protein